MILLLTAVMLTGPSPASQWPCDPPPRPIIDIGSAETYGRRLEVLNSFYARCFGRRTDYDMPVGYLASPAGRLRRQTNAKGRPGEVEIAPYTAYHARGYAAFTLTYPLPKPNGDFCSFALPVWTQADLDRRAEECYHAIIEKRAAAEAGPGTDPVP
jgi:hypothetical protein